MKAAPDVSPSYIRSQYTERLPQRDERVSKNEVQFSSVQDNSPAERNVSVEENRHHSWVGHARKIASSFSNTVSAGTSTLRKKSFGSPDVFDKVPISKNDLMSFKLTSASGTSCSKLPHSKISGLRKRFDRSKERHSIVFAPIDASRHESVPAAAGVSPSPLRLPLLKTSSSSESEGFKTSKFRSKSYAPYRSRTSVISPQAPFRRRNTEKTDSPLKQRIRLFESLDRHSPVPDPLHTTNDNQQSLSKPDEHERKDSIIAPLRSFRGQLRRISTSRRTPSEWSTTSSRDVGNSVLPSSNASPVAHDEQTGTAVAEEPLSPHTIDAIPLQPILKQTFLANEISPLVLEKPLSFPRASIARTGFNIDGEAGLGVTPLPLFAEPERRFSRTKHALSRAANRFSLPDVEKEFELIELLEDNLRSVSEENLSVSKARCILEQPIPVRANELKRLVSLCKEKVRKISGGRSEQSNASSHESCQEGK